MTDKQIALFNFFDESVPYFLKKLDGVDRDRYFADRDIRSILDKTINDLILCVVDIAEECLKFKNLSVPPTYRNTILACFEFVGSAATAVAPLASCRNDTIHEYLKINWQNIISVRNKVPEMQKFANSVRQILSDVAVGEKKTKGPQANAANDDPNDSGTTLR